MTEASVSRSMSSASTTSTVANKIDALLQGSYGTVDKIFPIFDQIMEKTKFPSWVMSTVAIFLLNQILSVSLWVYTPVFRRTSGNWRKFYDILIEIFAFQDPLNFTRADGVSVIITIAVAVFSIIWIILMILYNKRFYQVPKLLLYVTSFVLDIVDPLFIMPSVYVINHGITSLNYGYSHVFVIEIVVGAVAFAILMTIFQVSTYLKSRSVVLTNLAFPLFDHVSITTWVLSMTIFSILSAIFEYFKDWILVIEGIIHIMITLYICYRITFIPFYEVWRNAICLAYGITTIALDINFIVLWADDNLPYRYTIFVYIIVVVVSYICASIYFTQIAKKIKAQLTYDEKVTDVQEYLDELKIGKSSLNAMMYIVVGLAKVCDYFIDGSLTDYIINKGTLESAVSILLQIVTFFPSESRKMGVLYRKVLSQRNLNITDRFLVYQVYRIKTKRLISDTKDTLEMFNKLRLRNEHCKNIIKNFWEKQSCDEGFLTSLSIMLNDVDSFFKASIANNPNNLRIANEYANFLIECKCEFEMAVKQSVIAELIGDGKNFNVDVSFRSVVNKFPRYLKDHIFDEKGKRVSRMKSSGGSQMSNDQSSMKSTSISSSLSVDFERQEVVCKKILRDSKVRLAFHSAVGETSPKQSKLILFQIFVNFVAVTVFFVAFTAYLRSRLSWRRQSYQDLMTSSYSIFYNIVSNIYTLTSFAVQTHRASDNESILGDISIDKTIVTPLIPDNLNDVQRIYYTMNLSRNYMELFIENIVELAKEANPYEIAPIFLDSLTDFVVCSNATPAATVKSSLKGQLVTIDYLENSLAGQFSDGVKIDNIYQNNDYCQIASNLHTLVENSDETFQTILNFNINKSKDYHKEFYSWMVIGSVVIVLAISVSSMLIIASYNRMVKKMLKVLLSLPNADKEDAKKQLMLEYEDSSNLTTSTTISKSYIMTILPIFYFIFLAAIIVVFILLCKHSIDLNNEVTQLLTWFHYSCQRIIYASQIGNNIVQIILLNDSLPQEILNISQLYKSVREDLDSLLNANNILIYGNSQVKRTVGYDEEFDNIQLKPICDLGRDPYTIHDMYACSGIDAQIQIFKNMVVDVLNNADKYEGNLNSLVAANLIHLLRYHFYPDVMKATVRLAKLMEERYDSGMQMASIYVGLGFVFLIFELVLPVFFRKFVNDNYRVLMMLFQRLPPQTILNSKEILEFFTGRKRSAEEKMSTAKLIVYDANECIFITNSSSVIEIVNKSVSENLGLSPDQMLGQQIANFVLDADQQKINQQIDSMVNGQGPLICQDHISLLDEDALPIPFAMTMIGMKDNNDQVSSIVFIMINEQEEIQKRKEAEEAKAKSEKLLYQILPKNIVVRLNGGETDISFTIPSATIFFIDIVKFSAYASLLTPTEIMSNLSLVFATFDKIVAKYDLITKIKLIGDVYMAAAGLFMEDGSDPQKHADQAVRCCIECSKSLDEINAKLNASLEVRIGCNSGGPLIGGVLGTDKPTFDIIGDPINVAARLQSTDVPGNVQISEDTKNLIENLDYNIEQRGEVFLKGKGNRMTYFVSLAQKNEPEGSFILNLEGK